MTVAEMIAAVKLVVDEEDAVIRGWVLDRIRRMVANAKWRRLERNLGPTVAGDATYTVADDVVDVLNLWVGGHNYAPVTQDEMVELEGARAWIRGARGAWAPLYGTDASQGIKLWPTPSTAGDAITAIVAVLPPTTADGSAPPIPEDLHHHIWRGAIADGLAVGDEDPQAAKWEAEYREGEEILKARANSRLKKKAGRVRMRTY
jgi:hypothetical protein